VKQNVLFLGLDPGRPKIESVVFFYLKVYLLKFQEKSSTTLWVIYSQTDRLTDINTIYLVAVDNNCYSTCSCWWIVMWQQQISHSCSDTSLGIRRSVIYKNDGIKWQKFQDGFPNLFIEDVKNVTGRDGQLSLCINCSCYVDIRQMHCVITFSRDHSFPQPVKFWAEPRNLFVLQWKWARLQSWTWKATSKQV